MYSWPGKPDPSYRYSQLHQEILLQPWHWWRQDTESPAGYTRNALLTNPYFSHFLCKVMFHCSLGWPCSFETAHPWSSKMAQATGRREVGVGCTCGGPRAGVAPDLEARTATGPVLATPVMWAPSIRRFTGPASPTPLMRLVLSFCSPYTQYISHSLLWILGKNALSTVGHLRGTYVHRGCLSSANRAVAPLLFRKKNVILWLFEQSTNCLCLCASLSYSSRHRSSVHTMHLFTLNSLDFHLSLASVHCQE
jgi:hypothetical protein